MIFTLTRYYFGGQIKANEMGSGQVPHSGKERHMYRVWWEKVKEGDLLEDSGHSWEGDIKMYLKKWDGTGGLNEYGSGYRKVVGYSECSKEPLGATKCWQFLE